MLADYLEEGVRDGLIEDWIPDAGDPLVNEIDDTRLAGNDELLVLRRRLDPISNHHHLVKDHFCHMVDNPFSHDLHFFISTCICYIV